MESVIRTAIEDVLEAQGFDEVDFAVEHPSDMAHGDYSTNIALVIAKQAAKSPRACAEEIALLLKDQIEYVDSIEVAGAGFINFTLSRDFFVQEVVRAEKEGAEWGKNDVFEGRQILLEFTSPNLFKPLHVGNLVGNIVGESLARLFECAGADVKRINYPSDIGLTVAKGVWGLQKTGGDPEDILALGVAYRTGNDAYETDAVAKLEIEAVNRSLYACDDEVLRTLRERGLQTSKRKLDALCAMLGTTFDAVIYESEAGLRGTDIVRGKIGEVFEESEGAVVFKGEKVGLHTRVFLNSQGLPTYEAKDLGNFAIKQKLYPDWDSSIVVTGNEQAEYFKVEYAAIREVFGLDPQKELVHIPTGFLTLTTGKMSSRKGNVLTGESILEELREESLKKAAESRASDGKELGEQVAVAALKYQILKHGIGTNIIFDKAKALSFEGDSGPYLQYTHARANSVLEKARSAGVNELKMIPPEVPYQIERLLYRFPEVVEYALHEREPHRVATYLTALASAFNTFYAEEKIADVADVHASYKMVLTEAVKTTLKNGLFTLGIKAPERM